MDDMTDKEKLQEALEYLAATCELLFELEDDKGIACAVMVDNALRYVQDVYYDRDPRHSEQTHYEEMLKNKALKGV